MAEAGERSVGLITREESDQSQVTLEEAIRFWNSFEAGVQLARGENLAIRDALDELE